MGIVSGIYYVLNKQNGKVYIGSAVDMRHRWNEHRSSLRAGLHHSARLQRAWNKYGEDVFEFGILTECHRDELINNEQAMLDLIRPYVARIGYNNMPTAGSQLGLRHSEATREKMRLAKLGKKGPYRSEEWRNNIRLAHLGKKRGPRSAESSEKAAMKNRGKKRSVEDREKIRRGLLGKKKGVPWTQARWDAFLRSKILDYPCLPLGDIQCA